MVGKSGNAGRTVQLGNFWLSQRSGRPHWYITWFDEASRQTRRTTTRTSDLDEAQRLLAKHFMLHEKQHQERAADVLLMTVLHRYYEEHAQKLPSAQQARYAIQTLEEYFSDLTVAEFRPAQQQRMVDELTRKGNALGYISRILSVASAALRRSHSREEITSFPPILRLRKAGPKERVLSLMEAAALFGAARSQSMLRYLIIAFATGARPGAILDLKRDQLDFDGGLIRLNPIGRLQNKKGRPVLPMAPTLASILIDSEPGYLVHHGGSRYSRDGWRAMFNTLVKRAGLHDVSAYTIRHTVGTELSRRGVPMAEVSAFLGHNAVSSFGTTGRYVHYQPSYLQSAAEAIEAYLRELSGAVKRLGTAPAKVEMESGKVEISSLRAQCVPNASIRRPVVAPNALISMVGVTGFEPATYTSRTTDAGVTVGSCGLLALRLAGA